jgi:hypothetical protein
MEAPNLTQTAPITTYGSVSQNASATMLLNDDQVSRQRSAVAVAVIDCVRSVVVIQMEPAR